MLNLSGAFYNDPIILPMVLANPNCLRKAQKVCEKDL